MLQSDPIGLAVSDYYKTGKAKKLIVHSSQFDDDEIPVNYLFRKYSNLPEIEKSAIDNCKGKVLDIGACAGAHALILQEKGMDVTALEISDLCCDVMKKRGVKNVIQGDFLRTETEKYDTVLVLMNGTGLAGTIRNLGSFLKRLGSFLNSGGQILIDSSDLKYLYEEEDGSFLIDLNGDYYGEMDFQMEYNGIKGDAFPWLYVDPDTFALIAEQAGFSFRVLKEGSHYDYLAQLIKK
ncbi:class I SAM-dependent methyltransferase [Saccharicrinis sp. FJH62]|uniref:class I SAM-dependent methyltransferase n=1 Tax=Saccharicrinis sp. FJH62 TaxID=3344657 RepID=UPI0035D45330